MKYIKQFASLAAFNGFVLDSTNTPNISLIQENYGIQYTKYIPPHDYSQDYFTFVAIQNCTVNIDLYYDEVYDQEYDGPDYGLFRYSLDGGNTWSEEYGEINNIPVPAGSKLLLKGSLKTYPSSAIQPSEIPGQWIVSTGNYEVEGNIMSLFYGDNFRNQFTVTEKTILSNFFLDDTHLINAKNLILPATTLCDECYAHMFSGCTSLLTPPALPATSLVFRCYNSMFSGCTSLTTAPELPASILDSECYSYMFQNCTSLTKAPELLAPTLVNNCYEKMFDGCTSLNNIVCLAINNDAEWCTNFWVYKVSETGTFTKDSETSWATGSSGIPSGWTIIEVEGSYSGSGNGSGNGEGAEESSSNSSTSSSSQG